MTTTITYVGTNYFLLRAADGYMLIDAGWTGQWNRFLRGLKTVGISLGEIRYVFVTHHHHDHVGVIQKLREESNVKLIVHRNQVTYLTQGMTDVNNIKPINLFWKFVDLLTSPWIKYHYDPVEFREDDFVIDSLVDENLLRSIGIPGVVLSTPGHSKDSMSVLLDDGSAFIGDLGMNFGGVFNPCPLPIEAEDFCECCAHMQMLRERGAKTYFPSHGRPFHAQDGDDNHALYGTKTGNLCRSQDNQS